MSWVHIVACFGSGKETARIHTAPCTKNPSTTPSIEGERRKQFVISTTLKWRKGRQSKTSQVVCTRFHCSGVLLIKQVYKRITTATDNKKRIIYILIYVYLNINIKTKKCSAVCADQLNNLRTNVMRALTGSIFVHFSPFPWCLGSTLSRVSGPGRRRPEYIQHLVRKIPQPLPALKGREENNS